MADCETEGHVWEIGPYGRVTKCTFCGKFAETSPICAHGVLWTLNCSLCNRWLKSASARRQDEEACKADTASPCSEEPA